MSMQMPGPRARQMDPQGPRAQPMDPLRRRPGVAENHPFRRPQSFPIDPLAVPEAQIVFSRTSDPCRSIAHVGGPGGSIGHARGLVRSIGRFWAPDSSNRQCRRFSAYIGSARGPGESVGCVRGPRGDVPKAPAVSLAVPEAQRLPWLFQRSPVASVIPARAQWLHRQCPTS